MRIRRTIGIAAIIAMACISAIQLVTLPYYPNENPITFVEPQFAELKRMLPDHGVVGYISDLMPQFHTHYGAMQLVVARYSLAPLQVSGALDHDIVVGKFFDPARASEIMLANHLELVRDFGHGVFLFVRSPR